MVPYFELLSNFAHVATATVLGCSSADAAGYRAQFIWVFCVNFTVKKMMCSFMSLNTVEHSIIKKNK